MKRSTAFAGFFLPFSCGVAACVWFVSHAQQISNANAIKECSEINHYRRLISLTSSVGEVKYCAPIAAFNSNTPLPD